MISRRRWKASLHLKRTQRQLDAPIAYGTQDVEAHDTALLQILYKCTVNLGAALRSILRKTYLTSGQIISATRHRPLRALHQLPPLAVFYNVATLEIIGHCQRASPRYSGVPAANAGSRSRASQAFQSSIRVDTEVS